MTRPERSRVEGRRSIALQRAGNWVGGVYCHDHQMQGRRLAARWQAVAAGGLVDHDHHWQMRAAAQMRCGEGVKGDAARSRSRGCRRRPHRLPRRIRSCYKSDEDRPPCSSPHLLLCGALIRKPCAVNNNRNNYMCCSSTNRCSLMYVCFCFLSSFPDLSRAHGECTWS